MKPDPNKQKEVTAQSFKRIAKALRLRVENNEKLAKKASREGDLYGCHVASITASIQSAIAHELDFEATTLRAMR